MKNGILQWGDRDHSYPNEDFVSRSIAKGELFRFVTGDRIVGAVALNSIYKQQGTTGAVPCCRIF